MKVLVLEDDQERIAWFAHVFPKGVELIWTYTVRDFLTRLAALRNSDELALVLLDHDLFLMKKKELMKRGQLGVGFEDYMTDINGECGMTAVVKMPFVKCPTIVHSANEEDGPRMYKKLLKRGFDAHYFPYHMKRIDLRDKILRVLSK